MIQAFLSTPNPNSNRIMPNQNKLKYPKNQYRFSTGSDKVSFKGQIQNIPFNVLMRKIIGTLSKEDAHTISSQAEILSQRQKLGEINADSVLELHKKHMGEMLLQFKKFDINPEKTEQGLIFSDNSSTLSSKVRKTIKKTYLQVLIARNFFINLEQSDSLLKNPSINDWFENINMKGKIPNTFNSLYAHPVDKAKILMNDLSDGEQKFINRKAALTKQKMSIKNIMRTREIALSKIKSITDSSNLVEHGAFSELELQNLKKNVLNYNVLDRALSKNRIFSKEVESIVFNSTKKISNAKVGDYIGDLGLVVKKLNVYDKAEKRDVPCLVFFNKEERDFSFKLRKIDAKHEALVSEFANKYEKIKSLTNISASGISELAQNARTILNADKELVIARIHFNVVPVKNLKGILQDMNQPEKVETIINSMNSKGIDKIAWVVDFVNSDSKRYYEGGIKVALPMIDLLRKHNCNDIFLEALSIGENKKSPVPLYLRFGFKPFSHSEEEITKAMENHKFWDSKIPVYMYLPRNAMVNELVKKQKTLNEIFEFGNN